MAETKKYMDQTGLSHLWSKIKTLLTSKADAVHDHDEVSVGGIPTVTTAGDGAAYTATVDGVTELYTGLTIRIIPHTVSTTVTPTLDVNGLGAKYIRQQSAYNTGSATNAAVASFLTSGKPCDVQYNGTYWVWLATRPSADSFSGTLGIANGGTGAATVTAALMALNEVSGTPLRGAMVYNNLQSAGLVDAACTTAEVAEAMPEGSFFVWSHTTNATIHITDAPVSYGTVYLFKGAGMNYVSGFFISVGGYAYQYKHHTTTTSRNGWYKIVSNVLTSVEYGTSLPTDDYTAGRIFFKKA